MLASFSFASLAASPTATHVYPAPVKTGEAIAINVTIDPHNTMPISVVAYWWTSLSETRYQASLVNDSAQPTNWKGQIPAQSRPCDVYYSFQIDYLYYNANIGAQSMDTIYLPGATGNYLVSVKGELFGDLSPWAIAIGISLMILAVGVIIYAQRLVARMDPRFEDSVKARKEKVELPKEEKGSPAEGEAGQTQPSDQDEKINAGKLGRKERVESRGTPPSS